MSTYDLHTLGWNDLLQRQLIEPPLPGHRIGRIIGVHRSGWIVVTPEGESEIRPGVTGTDEQATVGDWLKVDVESKRATFLFERKSLFKRRSPGTDRSEQLIAANVDTLFIVSS